MSPAWGWVCRGLLVSFTPPVTTTSSSQQTELSHSLRDQNQTSPRKGEDIFDSDSAWRKRSPLEESESSHPSGNGTDVSALWPSTASRYHPVPPLCRGKGEAKLEFCCSFSRLLSSACCQHCPQVSREVRSAVVGDPASQETSHHSKHTSLEPHV